MNKLPIRGVTHMALTIATLLIVAAMIDLSVLGMAAGVLR